jgi:hypothetical protein
MGKDIEIINNKIHPRMRLNAVCPYFTMFPLSFPYNVLKEANSTDLVYDPFCGRGTTNYAARLLGLRSYGVDSNPVANAIAQAKLVRVKRNEIVNLCAEILFHYEPKQIPSGEFWDWAYHTDTLVDLCRIREYLLDRPKLRTVEIALQAIVLGVLHGPLMKTQASYLSNQMPRTFSTKPDYSVKYWKQRSLKPQYVNVLDLVKRRTEYVFNTEVPEKTTGKIALGDSRTIKNVFGKKFDWVVTSPPYFGMSTYEQDQWLRNWFLGGEERVDYSNRSQLKHWSEKAFIEDLGKVWSNTAKKCTTNAKLIIRFGALPSQCSKTPTEILKNSLASADCGWKLVNIRKAGTPVESKRQANQFKNSTGKYVEEIDAYARLK